ncbi:MAG: hypothetical protein N2422_06580 [Rhodobacteraceae bacterium]|nr:hypothetical protein [Paracoccaceae bacterium]
MILVEPASTDPARVDAAILFAARLRRRGHAAMVDGAVLPPGLPRGPRFDAAEVAGDPAVEAPSRLLVLGAEAPDPLRLAALGPLPAGVPVLAIGRFGPGQARAALVRLGYALNATPEAVDLSALLPGTAGAGALPPFGLDLGPPPAQDAAAPRLVVWLTEAEPPAAPPEPGAPPAEDGTGPQPQPQQHAPFDLAGLVAIDHVGGARLAVVARPDRRAALRQTRLADVPVWRDDELPPHALAALADIAVIAGDGPATPRLWAFAADMAASGRIVVDATAEGHLAASGAAVLRGPRAFAAIASYLGGTVLPRRDTIALSVRNNPWTAGAGFDRIEAALGLAPPVPAPAGGRRALFLPTNGTGIGHARRLSLLASGPGLSGRALFAAFPGCRGLIAAAGFPSMPLVSRSPRHADPYANDIINARRLRALAGPGDLLVFDGGYVFDSVVRAVACGGARAVWVRRGLWQKAQAGTVPPERLSIFARVIVPDEAFAELNDPLPFGHPPVQRVGPVVAVEQLGPDAREALRARIAAVTGRAFDRLVVSMLGGGQAADRAPQHHAVSHFAERRPGTLHLSVRWPGSPAPVPEGAWRNTVAVTTLGAAALAQAADAVVSACGYNSFHELTYLGVPAIYVPQMAPFMDDQDRRARAAADRGLACVVAPHELLALERRLEAMLEGDAAGAMRAAHAALSLPPPGTAAAAALILAELEA